MTFYNFIYLIVHTGVNTVRTINLPKARYLSNALATEDHTPDPVKTIAMAYWAIFIGHDLSHTAMSNMSRIIYITVYTD